MLWTPAQALLERERGARLGHGGGILNGVFTRVWRGAVAGASAVAAVCGLALSMSVILHASYRAGLGTIILAGPPVGWLAGAAGARLLKLPGPWLRSLGAVIGTLMLICVFFETEWAFPSGNPWILYGAIHVVTFAAASAVPGKIGCHAG
ncbi:MAG TPA: hypothetical protein VFC19_51640 [Candidatus Limnocylindrales bacterium]|nr:hypothetical protein [Candidatus Limnocylindrales bacterium]